MVENLARLIDVRVPATPEGVVIVLHGGARRGTMGVCPTQLSVVRMIPIARRISRDGGARLAVFRLLNSRRGWDSSQTPLDDVLVALDELAGRLGPLPVCLVGHSLGGRAALLAGGEDAVRGVVALAPWVLPSDDVSALAGKPVLIVHGADDRVASPARARLIAERLGPGTLELVPGAGHAMLRHHSRFSGAASRFARDVLLRDPDSPPVAPRGFSLGPSQ